MICSFHFLFLLIVCLFDSLLIHRSFDIGSRCKQSECCLVVCLGHGPAQPRTALDLGLDVVVVVISGVVETLKSAGLVWGGFIKAPVDG